MSEQAVFLFDKTKTIQENFLEFHSRNPAIYQYFRRFAIEMHERSRLISANMIVNRIRWEVMVNTGSGDFKINNNFSSRYARMFIDEFPHLKDCIEMREIRAL